VLIDSAIRAAKNGGYDWVTMPFIFSLILGKPRASPTWVWLGDARHSLERVPL